MITATSLENTKSMAEFARSVGGLIEKGLPIDVTQFALGIGRMIKEETFSVAGAAELIASLNGAEVEPNVKENYADCSRLLLLSLKKVDSRKQP